MKKFITMMLVIAALFVGQLGASETETTYNDWMWIGAGWVYVGDSGGPFDPPPPPPSL